MTDLLAAATCVTRHGLELGTEGGNVMRMDAAIPQVTELPDGEVFMADSISLLLIFRHYLSGLW